MDCTITKGDACLQEGVGMEAIQLAGHWRLDNLCIVSRAIPYGLPRVVLRVIGRFTTITKSLAMVLWTFAWQKM